MVHGPEQKFFRDEIQTDFKIKKKGLVGTANLGPNLNHSDVDTADCSSSSLSLTTI
jgi:cyclophilin family peptidyl-prolyl cis-trans isomerase